MYIKSICDDTKIHTHLLKPFFTCNGISEYETHLQCEPNITLFQSEEQAISLILRGNVAVFLPRQVYLFDANKVVNNSLSETTIETTLQGPQYALSEDLPTSLNIIRHRYPSTDLRVERMVLGTTSKTRLALLYDHGLVEKIYWMRSKKICIPLM